MKGTSNRRSNPGSLLDRPDAYLFSSPNLRAIARKPGSPQGTVVEDESRNAATCNVRKLAAANVCTLYRCWYAERASSTAGSAVRLCSSMTGSTSTDGTFSAFRVSGRLSGQVGLFFFNWRYQDDARRTHLWASSWFRGFSFLYT